MLLSIIIPIAPNDNSWKQLLPQLKNCPQPCEIILAGAIEPQMLESDFNHSVKTVFCQQGRAATLNAGACEATGKWLWFMHADSIITPAGLQCLYDVIQHTEQHGLWYFNLRFHSDNPYLNTRMKLNSLGVKVRSSFLKSPFGDQSFCIDKASFKQLQGYAENLPYGEDHAFIWHCHLADIPVQALDAYITTSARKYQQGGWFNISVLHNWLWFKQWLPLFSRWIWQQLWPR